MKDINKIGTFLRPNSLSNREKTHSKKQTSSNFDEIGQW